MIKITIQYFSFVFSCLFLQPYVTPLRIIMLTGGGLLAVLSSEGQNFEGAGPLAVIISAFTSIYFWTKQGWNIEDVC